MCFFTQGFPCSPPNPLTLSTLHFTGYTGMKRLLWWGIVVTILVIASKCTPTDMETMENPTTDLQAEDSKKFMLCIGHCRYSGWGRSRGRRGWRRPKKMRHHKRKKGWGWRPQPIIHYSHHHHHHHHHQSHNGGHGGGGGWRSRSHMRHGGWAEMHDDHHTEHHGGHYEEDLGWGWN